MNAEPHITMISSMPPIVGVSLYTKELVSALSQKIKITVLGFNHIYPKFLYPGELTDTTLTCPPETHNLKIKNILNWYNPFQWILEAFRIETAIIHAQWWSFPLAPTYFIILGINKLRGKKIILTIHNVELHEKNLIKTFFYRSIFFLGDEYIVHTDKNKQQLLRYIKNKPIHVIPHGIIQKHNKDVSKDDARKRLNISQDDKILLCFGHIRDYKGLDVAIEALAQIPDSHVKLLISGQCWEDWKKYDDLIKKHHLENRVILKLGFIKTEDVETAFTASDLALLPYKHFDAQSGVGALVLSFGIPLIVSNVGGLSGYVNNDDRFICEPKNAGQFAQKIQSTLYNPDLINQAKQKISEQKEKYSWENIARITCLTLYQSSANG